MQKTVSIKLNKDFLRLYRRKSYVNPSLVMYFSKNKLGINRIGITTSKKIGNAVQRNRARRIIREAYREIEPNTLIGYDFIFVARGRTVKIKTDDITGVMKSMFSNAGVLAK